MSKTLEIDDSIVVQHNDFLFSQYRTSKPLTRILSVMIGKCHSMKQAEFIEWRWSATEMAKVLGVESRGDYFQHCKKIARQAMFTSCVVPYREKGHTAHVVQTIDDAGKELLMFSSFKWNKAKDEFCLRLSNDIRRFLLEVTGDFTELNLQNWLSLRHPAAWKLYPIFSQLEYKSSQANTKEGTGARPLTELRLLLGTSYRLLDTSDIITKYPVFTDFKRKVVDMAMEEMKEIFSGRAHIRFLKTGRRVDRYEIYIDKPKKNQTRPRTRLLSSIDPNIEDSF